jgi:uncharacterized protein YegP (UPF0339 family)
MTGYYALTYYRDRQQKWRWRLKAGNGRKIATSGEGYSRKIDCEKMAHKLFPWLSPSEGGPDAGV